jgi:EPS-associated MarR family transcriptional regulator
MSSTPFRLDDETHYKFLRRLETNPNTSQRELAKALGLSLGRTNFCLKAIIDKGWVKARNFRRSDNKLAYIYVLTPKGLRAKTKLTANYLKRKLQEYDALQREIEQLQRETALGSDMPQGKEHPKE